MKTYQRTPGHIMSVDDALDILYDLRDILEEETEQEKADCCVILRESEQKKSIINAISSLLVLIPKAGKKETKGKVKFTKGDIIRRMNNEQLAELFVRKVNINHATYYVSTILKDEDGISDKTFYSKETAIEETVQYFEQVAE